MRNLLSAVAAVSLLVVSHASAEIKQVERTWIRPAIVADPPTLERYSALELSGLVADKPYPSSDDVCLSLKSNLMTLAFEGEGHFLIACPKHEVGAIIDRRVLQQADVIGNTRHWVVLKVPV